MVQTLFRPRSGLTALLGLLALSFVAPAPVQNGELSDKEQQAIGKAMAKYLHQKSSEKDKEKAKGEITSTLEKFGKKKGAKEASDALTLGLSLTQDLGRAVYFSGEYKAALKGGKVLNEEVAVLAPTKLPYALSLPSTYKSNGPALPLILCIPDIKDGKPVTPGEFLTQNLTDAPIRDGAAIAVVTMPAAKDEWNVLDTSARRGGITNTMFTWGDVVAKVPIDADRVFILGRGFDGVATAMQVATRYPHRFAGVIGMAGDATADVGPANFHNLPTYFVGAGANATAFEAKVKELGFNNCTLKADGTAADVWSWISQTTRVANPLKVSFLPGNPFPDRAYWVRIPPTEGVTAPVTAEADRATNTIKVSALGVRNVTLYFNAAIVDFTKEVTIDVNGKTRKEKIVPTVEDLLSNLTSSDNGRVFVAKRVYDISK